MAEAQKKKRISTLANQYEVTSELLLRLLKGAKVPVRTPSNMIDAETFLKIKPALLVEKQKLERQAMAKAGIKIPMKAVLKKSAEKTKPKIEGKKSPEAAIEKPAADKTAGEPKAIAPPPSPAPPSQDLEKTGPVGPVPQPDEEPPKPTSDDSEESGAGLKVEVEKPDEQTAARIQKLMTDRAAVRGQGKGYSGRFGKIPVSQHPRRREGAPGERPKDVFAMRAQEAGVFAPGQEVKTEPRRDHQRPAKRLAPRGGRRRKSKEQVEQELSEMRTSVSKVMATLGRGQAKIKHRKERAEEAQGMEKKTLEVAEFITISELAGLMGVRPNEVIAKCMELGIMVTINQRLDHETIAIIADEFSYQVKLMDEYIEEVPDIETLAEEKGKTVLRAPIVTIMGHVDHGKSSILDYIRKSHIVEGEAGGITQHIGAYSVDTPHGSVCFLDTPGHEAFSAMRSRGAHVTDLVVLVVAADSAVMPQTKEAIQHARAANVPIVVAINKVDLPEANIDKIKSQLSEHGVQVEGWGGNVSAVEVSAKTGAGIDKLLDTLALEAEVLELKASPKNKAKGAVVETRLDKGMGTVVTVLVQDGTLRVGDPFVVGSYSGKVRSLLDDRGKRVQEAGPSSPVQVLGAEGTPQAGDTFSVVDSERDARDRAGRRREAAKDRELRQKQHITLEQLHEQIEAGEFHELKIIVKGDVDGSVEAISSALERQSTKEVKVNIIHKGVGAVKEADVHLASASDALIVAFHVLPGESVRQLAEEEGVTINYYRVIYDLVEDVRSAMEGMLRPDLVEQVTGEAKILQLFKIPKVGIVAGCRVTDGTADRDSKVRVYREGIEVGEAVVSSLKRLKDDVKSVKSGLECGIGIGGVKDLQVDDVLAFFKRVEVSKKLSVAEQA